MQKLTDLDRALHQEALQARHLQERRTCCGTLTGHLHLATCPELPLGRHCQTGGEMCLAGNADGVCCPPDCCDIDERVRCRPKQAADTAATGQTGPAGEVARFSPGADSLGGLRP